MLRVVVESGGCSGFQYKFELDSHALPDDKLVSCSGWDWWAGGQQFGGDIG